MIDAFEKFTSGMFDLIPETRLGYVKSIAENGEVLETVVVEDVFMPTILLMLRQDKEHLLLQRIFNYFEEIFSTDDKYLHNILFVTVLEILGNDKKVLEAAQKYMGLKTQENQLKADIELGRAR